MKKTEQWVFGFSDCIELADSQPHTRFCGEDLPGLQEAFERWLPLLNCEQFEVTGQGYICLYFPSEIEREIESCFAYSPASGWSMSALAWVILSLAARHKLGAAPCLPLPAITEELEAVLMKRGLFNRGLWQHAFCLFSFFPFRLSCNVCSLRAGCPKILD
ncbi:MAG: hypothetical protein IJD04_08670 [Desulfovibrionaceae bacterium]|nr:hypothetical protein [Desulfovibrionaceae bacterium]